MVAYHRPMDKRGIDTFASRMRGYESVAQSTLMSRTPVIVRVDGKNFSARTRLMEKPFDGRMRQCMEAAAMRLCAEVQNCRIAYFQSDEVSLLLTDFQLLNTETWFGNQVQKVCSVAAATATAGFIEEYIRLFPGPDRLPVFDARCFNLPREEVVNYFVWRQRDAERNSVSMAAQAHFSHRELQGLDRVQMMDMLVRQRGIDWNDYDAAFKGGQVVIKERASPTVVIGGDVVSRSRWVVSDAPIFARDRDPIDTFLHDEEVRVG